MSDSESDHETKDDELIGDEDKPAKKKPGRPRKQAPKKPIKRQGIVQEPSNKDIVRDPRLHYILEVFYDQPVMFKRIFTVYKAFNVETIRVRYGMDQLVFYAKDRLGKSQIYTRVFGSGMLRYYCARELEIGMNPNNFQRLLQTLNKDIGKIVITAKKQYEKSKIRFSLINEEMAADDNHDIDIDAVEPYNWAVETALKQEDTYPIKFELPSRFFKRKVNDSKTMTEIMRIEKNGKGPLQFAFTYSNKRGVSEQNFNDPGKINLRSTIDDDDMFTSSINLEYLKPLANTPISETVKISADPVHDMIFTCLLDQDEDNSKKKIPGTEKCEVKVIIPVMGKKKDEAEKHEKPENAGTKPFRGRPDN